MIHEFRNPVPVITPMGDGYAIYVRDGGGIGKITNATIKGSLIVGTP